MGSAEPALTRARDFLWQFARLVERREFETAFLGAQTDALLDAVRAYRNPDGGLGHALEPDLRAPSSQPIFIDAGLGILGQSRIQDLSLLAGICGFLAGIARADGAIPYALPTALEHARADHWNGAYALEPSLLATSGVAGKLHALGARHEWLDRATAWCLEQIAGHPEYSSHRMLNVLDFLRHVPDRDAARELWGRATARLFEADLVLVEIPATTYGLSPLGFAPTPDAPARPLFPDALIERHLDHLLSQQQPDGGWPLSWEPPGPAAVCEWRGRFTLDALHILRAYGRL